MSNANIKLIVSAVDNASGPLGKISGALGSLGKMATSAAIVGLGAAFSALGGAVAFSVKEAMDAQKVQAQLEAVLQSTKGVAGLTAEEINKMATSLSNVTTYTDDAIVQASAVMLTFTKIGKDVFPAATEAAMNISTALGQDLQSSIVQVGKALNDPIEGVSALRRVGIQFTEEQEKMIKSLVESGDLLGAQGIILDELETQFGGAAEAIGGTFGGQLEIFKNQLSNIAEEVGMQLLPIMTEGLKALAPIIVDLATQFAAFVSSDEFKKWMADAIVAIGNVAKWLRDDLPPAIQKTSEFWNGVLKPALEAVWSILTTKIIPIIMQIANFYLTHWGAQIEWIAGVWQKLSPVVQTVFEAINRIAVVFIAGFERIFSVFQLAFEGRWYDFGAALRDMLDDVWTAIKTAASNAWDWLKAQIPILISNIKSFFTNTDWSGIGKNIISGIAEGISSAARGLADAAISAAQAALAAVEGFLGIESPSKVFAGIGENMMLGMAQGITGASGAPVAAAVGAASSISNYTMNVYTNAPTSTLIRDFSIMRSMS